MPTWEVPEMWAGATVYILGGGPSLRDVDVERLKGERIIASNNAYQLADWIPMMYFMDCKWFHWHDEKLARWPGIRVTSCRECRDIPWIKYLDTGHRYNLDKRPNRISRGTNCGFGSMALAVKLGAKRIILFGFDMRIVKGEFNWHKDHERKVPETIFERNFFKCFEEAKPILIQRGIEVINATPGSALPTFPIVSPETVYPTARAA